MNQSIDLFLAQGATGVLGDDSLTPVPLRYKNAPLVKAKLTNDTWEPYIPFLDIKGARRHPVPLVESATLSAIRTPRPTYHPMLEPAIVSRAILSLEQLEAVILAGNENEKFFPMHIGKVKDPVTQEYRDVVRNCRSAIMVADGTGAGKTRIGGGIIRDQWNRNARHHVWISLKAALIDGVKNMWQELLGDAAEVRPWPKTGLNEGINFVSYAKLVREDIKEIMARFGPVDAFGVCTSYNGVIIIDEAHANANASPTETVHDATRKASQRGGLLLLLQQLLPNARVTYLTATSAERTDALAYASRLNIAGIDSAFKSHSAFAKTISASGTAAMEAVCLSLKGQGKLIARTLSYEGVEYSRMLVPLDDQDRRVYDAVVDIWQETETGFRDTAVRLNWAYFDAESNKYVGYSKSPFGTTMARLKGIRREFFAQVINTLMLPRIIGQVEEALRDDMSIVYQITHTGAAALERALKDFDPTNPLGLEDIDVSYRPVLRALVQSNFPITPMMIDYEGEATPLLDENGSPVEDVDALEERKALIQRIDSGIFPQLGNDLLNERFGDLVGEVTGRLQYLTREDKGIFGTPRVIRKRTPKSNERDLVAFAAGDKRIMIISEAAGGTGFDLHASTQIKNQQKRLHIIGECSLSATAMMQAAGRTHRTGQLHPPRYLCPMLDLPAHRALASTPARKLADLGALSRGHRATGTNGFLSADDNLQSIITAQALIRVETAIGTGTHAAISEDEYLKELGEMPNLEGVGRARRGLSTEQKQLVRYVKHFLDRLLTAHTEFQERMLAALLEERDALIQELTAANRYDDGMSTWKPMTATIVRRELLDATRKNFPVQLVEIETGDLPAARLAWPEIQRLYKRNQDLANPPIFVDAQATVGLLFPSQNGYAPQLYTPAGRRSTSRLESSVWPELSLTDAEAAWTKHFAALPILRRRVTLAVGDLISVWAKLGMSIRIIRLALDDGSTIIGRLVANDDLQSVRGNFGLISDAVDEPLAA